MPAKLVKCATALAASFDPELVGEISARILAPEAKLKGASLVLGPTCNIQRVIQVFTLCFDFSLTLIYSHLWEVV